MNTSDDKGKKIYRSTIVKDQPISVQIPLVKNLNNIDQFEVEDIVTENLKNNKHSSLSLKRKFLILSAMTFLFSGLVLIFFFYSPAIVFSEHISSLNNYPRYHGNDEHTSVGSYQQEEEIDNHDFNVPHQEWYPHPLIQRFSSFVVPPQSEYAGIHRADYDQTLTDGNIWKNPLENVNNYWMLESQFVLTIGKCLSRALDSNYLRSNHNRVSLCFEPRKFDESVKKAVYLMNFNHNSTTGDLQLNIRNRVRLNQSEWNSLVSMSSWVNAWFFNPEINEEQLRLGSYTLSDLILMTNLMITHPYVTDKPIYTDTTSRSRHMHNQLLFGRKYDKNEGHISEEAEMTYSAQKWFSHAYDFFLDIKDKHNQMMEVAENRDLVYSDDIIT